MCCLQWLKRHPSPTDAHCLGLKDWSSQRVCIDLASSALSQWPIFPWWHDLYWEFPTACVSNFLHQVLIYQPKFICLHRLPEMGFSVIYKNKSQPLWGIVYIPLWPINLLKLSSWVVCGAFAELSSLSRWNVFKCFYHLLKPESINSHSPSPPTTQPSSDTHLFSASIDLLSGLCR